MPNFGEECRRMAEDVTSILGDGVDDDGVGEGVTYRFRTVRAKNYGTGAKDPAYVALTLDAVGGPVTTDPFGAGDTRTIMEERTFTINTAEYRAAIAAASGAPPYREPGDNDVIVDATNVVWPVVRAHAEVGRRLFRVRCRRSR